MTATFKSGDPVRVKTENRPGHVRTPAYVRGKLGWVENDVALGGIELAVGLVCELRLPEHCPRLQRQVPQLERPFARPRRFVRATSGGKRRNESADACSAQSAENVAARARAGLYQGTADRRGRL